MDSKEIDLINGKCLSWFINGSKKLNWLMKKKNIEIWIDWNKYEKEYFNKLIN